MYDLWLADRLRPEVGHLMTNHGPSLCRAVILTGRAGPPTPETTVCPQCLATLPDDVDLDKVIRR